MKALLALALMLAIGNTAAAGLLGVSMGDPIKPDDGWSAGGYGQETREYKSSLNLGRLLIGGTRDGGACEVAAIWSESSIEEAKGNIAITAMFLASKYGEHDKEETSETASEARLSMRWFISDSDTNPDNIDEILFSISRSKSGTDIENFEMVITYWFKNHHECRKAKEGELGL